VASRLGRADPNLMPGAAPVSPDAAAVKIV